MDILTGELTKSDIAGNRSHIIGPAALMTSLDMHGFSVSVFPYGTDDLDLLFTPVSPSAWPGVNALVASEVLPLPDGLAPIAPVASRHDKTAQFITRCCRMLMAAEAGLNALDAKSGDGDTGSTLAGAAKALIDALDRLPLADHTQLYRAIGQELSQTMGGSSGVLLAIFFAAAGDASASGLSVRDALKAGLARMQEIGGAKPGDRTIIDALQPALEALPDGLPAATIAARKGADHTATLGKANAGRATYINAAQLTGHTDPGAEAVAMLFERLAATASAA